MGFFDQDNGGYNPMTVGAADPSLSWSNQPPQQGISPQSNDVADWLRSLISGSAGTGQPGGIGSDANAPQPQPGVMDRLGSIFKSLGVDPNDIGNMVRTSAGGFPQPVVPPRGTTGGQSVMDTFFPQPPQQPPQARGIGGEINAPLAPQQPMPGRPGVGGEINAPLTRDPPAFDDFGRPLFPPGSIGSTQPQGGPGAGAEINAPMTSRLPLGGYVQGDPTDPRRAPLPPIPTNQTANVVAGPGTNPAPAGSGIGNESQRPYLTSQNGQQVPTFGIPGGQVRANAAPTPPGMAVNPAAPPGSPTQPNQESGPQDGFLKRMLGGDRGIQQIMAGIGKGAANIQGKGKFASAARGAGLGIQGAQGEADKQFDQQIRANAQKLAVDAYQDKKPVWQAQANYFDARARQQEAIAKGETSSKAWQNTPYGRAYQTEKLVQEDFQKKQEALLKEATGGLLPGGAAEYQKKKNELEQQKTAALDQMYRKLGVPKGQDGKSASTPLDVSKMNPMEVEGMPNGTYYIDPKTKQVTVRNYDKHPPPGWAKGPDGVWRQQQQTTDRPISADYNITE